MSRTRTFEVTNFVFCILRINSTFSPNGGEVVSQVELFVKFNTTFTPACASEGWATSLPVCEHGVQKKGFCSGCWEIKGFWSYCSVALVVKDAALPPPSSGDKARIPQGFRVVFFCTWWPVIGAKRSLWIFYLVLYIALLIKALVWTCLFFVWQ